MAVGARDPLMDLSLANQDSKGAGNCGGHDRPRFELRTFEDVGELEQVWRDLERRASTPLFLSWDWIGCWVREASLMPIVLIGRAAGAIVLLGILTPSATRGWLPVTMRGLQLHMTGDTGQDVITIEYNGFLVAEDLAGRLEADAIAFLLSGLTIDGHRCEELHLKNVPAVLEKSVRASGFRFREIQHKPSWRIDLADIRAAGKQYPGLPQCEHASTDPAVDAPV